jgi:hypothetical protein
LPNIPPDTIDTIIPRPLPAPPNAKRCNTKTFSGGDGVDEKLFILGTQSGMVTINYDMATEPDKLEVFYENRRVASTFTISGNNNGFVGGGNNAGSTGKLTFLYKFNREQFVKVRLTGGIGTSWNYTIGCPR